MLFELKVIEKIHCPRCNGIAELRIDIKSPKNDLVLVYTVCPVCRLKKYNHTTTKRAVEIQHRINKLNNNPKKTKRILDRIKQLEEMKRGAERKV